MCNGLLPSIYGFSSVKSFGIATMVDHRFEIQDLLVKPGLILNALPVKGGMTEDDRKKTHRIQLRGKVACQTAGIQLAAVQFVPTPLNGACAENAPDDGPHMESRRRGLDPLFCEEWGLCEYVIVHTILGGSPVILWISLGGKPKWLPLKFGYHDVMRTSPIDRTLRFSDQAE